MEMQRRRWAVVAVAILGSVGLFAPLALAQVDPSLPAVDPAAPTTVTPTASPSTVTPGAETVPSVVPGTDPLLPDGQLPAPVVPDPFAASPESLSSGSYSDQPPFASIPGGVDPTLVRAATARLSTATAAFESASAGASTAAQALEELAARIELNGAQRAADIEAAAQAKRLMTERIVEAYVRGDRSWMVWSRIDNPSDYSRAARYLESLAGQDRTAAERYLESVRRLSSEEVQLVDDQARLVDAQTQSALALDDARFELANAVFCADAAALGARACPDGFVFPVLGEVNFIDSWGFPRQSGNANQHWHEGTDIMAPTGREIVAVEGGTLTKLGDDSGLGGIRLWLEGDSGNRYYYAHFDFLVPGLTVGQRVEAATVLGGAGSTGAPGSASHLHFEVYPAGSARPVNPFPLLKAAWGDRPMRSEAEVSMGLANMSGSLPPEEQ